MKDSLLDIIENFNTKYNDLKRKLPYSFNLLDEIKANENAHSKILKKLLGFKEGDKYPFLKSFLEYVGFDDLSSKIKNPEILAEKDRIDITIIDNDYAIIIENKIHNAREQVKNGGQVNRYVGIVKKEKFKNKIFVLYLTRRGGEPSEKSLSEEIRSELKDKYKAISYRDNILPWLETKVLPQCDFKNEILLAGIQQYIHHLKGIFKTRKEMNEMNEELLKYLQSSIQIKDDLDLKEHFGKIETFEKKLNTLNDYLNKMKVRIRKESKNKFKEYNNRWQEEIIKEYQKNVIPWDRNEIGYCWFGIEMKYHGKRFLCGIGYDNIKEQNSEQIIPYYGITCRPESNAKDPDVENFVTREFKIDGSKPTTNWYIQKRASFDNVFLEFKKYLYKVQMHDKVELIKN